MPPPTLCSARRRARALATIAVATALATPTGPAAAHPFGPPPTAEVQVGGRRIEVTWSSQPDDAIAVGIAVGVLEEEALAAYQEGAVQVAPAAVDTAALDASPALRDYLATRITASQDGRPCPAQVAPVEDFVGTGARLVLTCPQEVTAVDLGISVLHDVHPAYRTLAVDRGTGHQAAFTVAAPVHRWGPAVAAGGTGGVPWWLPVAAAALLLVPAAVLLAGRRRRPGP